MPNYEIIYTVEAPDAATALSAAQYGVDDISGIAPVLGVFVQAAGKTVAKLDTEPGVKRLTEPYRPQYAEFSD